MSKIYPFLILLILQFKISCAQFFSDQVNFDHYQSPTDNDLSNYFSGQHGFVQIQTNGITGGCLQTPDTNIWGNDNAHYCSHFAAAADTLFNVSISFFADPSQIGVGFDRAVSIWLRPHNDPNHYIIASVSHSGNLEVHSYSTFDQSVSPLGLQANNWYRLRLSVLFVYGTTMDVEFVANVDHLGPTGMGVPVQIESLGNNITDSIFLFDDDIDVSLTGARNGGAVYLDNFYYYGTRSTGSCLINTMISISSDRIQPVVKTNGTVLNISGKNLQGAYMLIYDLDGKLIQSALLESDASTFDLQHMRGSIYTVILRSDEYVYRKKVCFLKQ